MMQLTMSPSVTGGSRFSNKRGRKSAPSARKEVDERPRRKAIAKQRPVVNYGKGKNPRLVQGQSDEPKNLPIGRMPAVVSKQSRKFGNSRA